MKFLEKYGVFLSNKDNINTALTHSSFANEHNCESYERLEFLGDAVLETITSEYFYNNYDYKEGKMSKLRAMYVCEHALYEYSKKIGYAPYIKVGNGQIHNVNETIIADVFEAILGAIFLECGYETSKNYVLDIILPFIENGTVFYSDYKSALQEMVQTDRKSLEYSIVEEDGPAHDKKFKIDVLVDGIVYGTGIGKSKKEAEQHAAFSALKKSVNNKE